MIESVGRVWKPTPRQEQFLSLPDQIFEALFGGAAGGGKSDTLLMLPICRGFHQSPRFKGILFRRTYPELEKELILRSFNWYKDAGGTYNDQKKRWMFPSGAVMQFGYAEHEKDVRNYDTAEYNYMGFDEVTSFTEFMYLYLALTRVRSSDSNLPSIVRSGTNPGNIGHSFFKKRFVDPDKNGGVVLRERRIISGAERDLLRIFIPSLVSDNEHLIKADPGYIVRLNALPESEKAAKLLGSWDSFEGQVFDDFRDNKDHQKYSDEPDWACHVVPAFTIPHYWPKVLSIDWGFRALNIAGFYAINPFPTASRPAKIYKYRELCHTKTKIKVWCTELKNTIEAAGESFVDFTLDPSAWGNRGDEETIAEQIFTHTGLTPRKADNNRISGKQLMQEYLRWKVIPGRDINEIYSSELAAEISRKLGPEGLKEYNERFIPQEVDKYLPKFQIFENCIETIKTIPLCTYDKKNPEDVAEFEGDDPYDETRYGLKACQSYLELGKTEHIKEHALAKVEDQLARTGDYTQYYINLNSMKKRLNTVGRESNHGFRMRKRLVGR